MESCLEHSLNAITVATNNFSDSNKLGEGGFGAVYKGRLPNGNLIAVKRLTRHTAHGDSEFKNEVQLVAKLHHKNLIRLLGFSLGARERILIYELALNGSLDSTLFEPAYLMNIGDDDEASLPIMGEYSETRVHEIEPRSHMSSALLSSSHGFSSVNEISFTNTYPDPR